MKKIRERERKKMLKNDFTFIAHINPEEGKVSKEKITPTCKPDKCCSRLLYALFFGVLLLI